MGVPIGRAHLWLDGRYVLGLTDIDDDAEEDLDLRNYHFAVTAGLSVPLWSGPRALASLR